MMMMITTQHLILEIPSNFNKESLNVFAQQSKGKGKAVP
jgi:hypothetical protein